MDRSTLIGFFFTNLGLLWLEFKSLLLSRLRTLYLMFCIVLKMFVIKILVQLITICLQWILSRLWRVWPREALPDKAVWARVIVSTLILFQSKQQINNVQIQYRIIFHTYFQLSHFKRFNDIIKNHWFVYLVTMHRAQWTQWSPVFCLCVCVFSFFFFFYFSMTNTLSYGTVHV